MEFKEVICLKILIIPSSMDEINELKPYYDGIIIGVKDLSINVNLYLTVDEINNLNLDKEVFIAINKNMHNEDLDYLEKTLKSLKNIKGVLYYDAAVVYLYSKIKPDYDLVWSQEHLTTSSVTCNFWYEKNVKYTYLSSEITLEEILNIKKNTNMKLIVPIFGYIPMFVSKRPLVKNYLGFNNIEDNSTINYLKKNDKLYPIIDNKLTIVYSNNILASMEAYKTLEENKIDYVTFNSFNIDSKKFLEVLKIFKGESNKKLTDLFENIDNGFLYEETIYKVKKND